jgi:hypothetical protein
MDTISLKKYSLEFCPRAKLQKHKNNKKVGCFTKYALDAFLLKHFKSGKKLEVNIYSGRRYSQFNVTVHNGTQHNDDKHCDTA